MQTGDIDAAGYLANYVKRKASQELSSLSSTVMFNAESYKKQTICICGNIKFPSSYKVIANFSLL